MAQADTNVDALLKARAEIDEKLRRYKNTLTVLFTDVAGSTSFFERFGDTAGLAMICRHAELAKSAVQHHKGSVIKTIGDSVMAEFPDAGSAVRAAAKIQRQLLEHNLTLPQQKRLELRIGIHTGVGFRKSNDIFGDVVNVAARITKRTAPAQILISRAVQEAVSGDSDLVCQWLSKLTIDGRTEKEDIFEVLWTDPATYRELRQRLAGPASFPSRYEVLSHVGTGGTGMVYKARDLETGETVALKILKPEIASDPDVQENFKKELRLARRITHKNVCRIHEFSRSNGTAYTSMEFIEGESLLSTLHRVGALPLNQAIDIIRQICAGLREAHAQGIVHRDLKPANIMVDRSGSVKIMDFGVARLVQGNGQMTGTIVGTPAYMAPEQAELKPVDARTDVYAVGLLLYEMVTGMPAFDGDTPVAVALKQVRELPRRPRELMPTVPVRVEGAILKCLEKDPARRFQSVDQLDQALDKAMRVQPQAGWKATLVPKLREASLACYRSVRSYLEEYSGRAIAFVQRQDWQAIGKKMRSEPALGLAAVLVLGGLAALVLGSSGKSRASSPGSADVATVNTLQNSPTPAPANESLKAPSSDPDKVAAQSSVPLDSASALNAPRIVTTQEADLARDSALALNPHPVAVADAKPAESDVAVEPSPAPMVKPPTPRASRRAKTPSRAKELKGQANERDTKPAEAQTLANPAPPPTAPAAAVAQPAVTPAPVNTPGPKPVAQLTVPKPAAPVPDAKNPRTIQADPGPPTPVYLEVGSFKDEPWAESAVDKLSQLGFHAISVRKTRLWVKAYHVQVGPYTDAKQLEEARQRLSSQGFKAHPVN